MSAAALGGIPEAAVEDARRWERHIIEVMTGVPPDAPPGTPARPGFDRAAYSLAQREQAEGIVVAVANQAMPRSLSLATKRGG